MDDKKLELATDNECVARRNALISAGIITPAKKEELVFQDGKAVAIYTKRIRHKERKNLIKLGIIDTNYCELFPYVPSNYNKEEGEYKVRPISSNYHYEKKKRAYFRIMQEILRSREELNLVLGPKKESDPDWVF